MGVWLGTSPDCALLLASHAQYLFEIHDCSLLESSPVKTRAIMHLSDSDSKMDRTIKFGRMFWKMWYSQLGYDVKQVYSSGHFASQMTYVERFQTCTLRFDSMKHCKTGHTTVAVVQQP